MAQPRPGRGRPRGDQLTTAARTRLPGSCRGWRGGGSIGEPGAGSHHDSRSRCDGGSSRREPGAGGQPGGQGAAPRRQRTRARRARSARQPGTAPRRQRRRNRHGRPPRTPMRRARGAVIGREPVPPPGDLPGLLQVVPDAVHKHGADAGVPRDHPVGSRRVGYQRLSSRLPQRARLRAGRPGDGAR